MASATTPAPATTAGPGYVAIPVVLGFAILLCLGIMGAVRFITRTLNRIVPTAERTSTYECGETPVGRAWFRFNNRFYRIALVFLVCDCLFALLLPVLPRLRHQVALGLGTSALAALAVVAVCTALGIAHAARNRDLEWSKVTARVGSSHPPARGGGIAQRWRGEAAEWRQCAPAGASMRSPAGRRASPDGLARAAQASDASGNSAGDALSGGECPPMANKAPSGEAGNPAKLGFSPQAKEGSELSQNKSVKGPHHG